MKASVVITSYNDDQRLSNTLWGWAGQTDKDFELMVVNDGGDNPHTTEELVTNISKYHPHINYVYMGPSKKELGGQVFRLSAARNVGLRLSSRGQLCIISDCDTIPHPELIARMSAKDNGKRIVLGVRKRIAIKHAEALGPEDFHRLETLSYCEDERLKYDRFHRLKDTARCSCLPPRPSSSRSSPLHST